MVVEKRERPAATFHGVGIQPRVIIQGAVGVLPGLIVGIPLLRFTPIWLAGPVMLIAMGVGVFFMLGRTRAGLKQTFVRSTWDMTRAGEHKVWYCGHDVTIPPDRDLYTLMLV